MLSETMNKALNEQIKHELYSSYLYLSMAAYSQSLNLSGFAHWMRLQSEEERGHAMRLFDFVNDRGGRILLESLPQPPAEFGSPIRMFEEVLKHESEMTSLIHQLYQQAVQEKDLAAQVELHWFIKEQVEEEDSARTILEKLRMVGEQPTALFMMDRALGERKGG